MTRTHHRARHLPLALVLGAATLLAGARPGWADDSATSTKAEHTPMACDRKIPVAELDSIKAPKAAKPYRIELSVPSLANPYIVAVIYGATLAAKDAGVTLGIDAGKGFMDPASQIREVENALSRKTDALLINPADPNGMVATIDDTVDSGIPVFDVGTLSSSTKSYKVVQDDYSQGGIAADIIGKMLPKGGSGIVQGGPANATWARRRVAGFTDAIKAFPGITISVVTNEDINPTQGLEKFSDAAQAHPRVDWIYATFNILLPPPSIPPEYKGAVYVGGAYDPIMVASLKDGSAAAAIPDFPVSVGYIGVASAVERLNGATVPMRTCIPSTAITKADVTDPVWAKTNSIPAGWTVPGG
jgi:ribose transport system permease protein